MILEEVEIEFLKSLNEVGDLREDLFILNRNRRYGTVLLVYVSLVIVFDFFVSWPPGFSIPTVTRYIPSMAGMLNNALTLQLPSISPKSPSICSAVQC